MTKSVLQLDEPSEQSPPKIVMLSDLALEIRRRTGTSPTYSKLWQLVVDGLLPAEKRAHRYYVDVAVAVDTLRKAALI